MLLLSEIANTELCTSLFSLSKWGKIANTHDKTLVGWALPILLLFTGAIAHNKRAISHILHSHVLNCR